MQKSLQITLRDIPPSEPMERLIRERTAKLESVYPRLTGCHVTLETPHRHKTHGRHFRVCIVLGVPGRPIVIARDPDARRSHEDAYVAVGEAFDHADRVLHDHLRRHRYS